jgi:uncharacterized membrane protein YeaQ/YmgE (transglycosylase-associated protein family)
MDFFGIIGALIASPFICLGWIIVGVIAGALARQMMGGGRKGACSDFVLGILGAVVGGFLLSLLDINRATSGLAGVITTLIVATVGACLLIGLGRVFARR